MKTIEVLDLPEDARELVRECEAKGARTLFQRNGRPVALLVSYDEYTALRETIEIANDADLGAMINAASEEESVPHGERVRLAISAEAAVNALAEHEREIVRDALQRIDDDPIIGAPLFDPLKGLWSYRAEHLRVIYRIVAEARWVVVLSVTRAPVS
ncbi:MAG TPA: type II toxin-antitoxin system Phd/YefM family antitoxin [Vicinamibacterales bacterium]|nr:type II toxin-antitoxin system Phd/YefM family antitoxin [Vicinamibacterales bacterium]